jgi:hypothetical protein
MALARQLVDPAAVQPMVPPQPAADAAPSPIPAPTPAPAVLPGLDVRV